MKLPTIRTDRGSTQPWVARLAGLVAVVTSLRITLRN
jgi:hypothetical protein